MLPGELNAIKNRAHCYKELTTLPGEVDVRLITLLGLFGRTKGRVGDGKTKKTTATKKMGGVGPEAGALSGLAVASPLRLS